MAGFMRNVVIGLVCGSLILAMELAEAERPLKFVDRGNNVQKEDGFADFILQLWNLSKRDPSWHHVWPEMRFGWRIVLGSIICFFGAAFGSIGGVGGGGIFVPMLTLIIGFDPKSSTAISKCMIMGAAGSTVYYNLRLRHPTLDLPIIDYDLALLFQPMLMLGISIGVAFNVMFADWMVTVLLIVLFLSTSTKAFFKGIETWKKETVMKKEAAKLLESYGKMNGEFESPKTPPFPQEVYEDGPTLGYKPLPGGPTLGYKPLPGGPSSNGQQKLRSDEEVSLIENVYWRDLMLLVLVWIAFLTIQIVKTYAKTCSIEYWILNSLQVPIALSVTLYEGICLYTGKRTIVSDGKQDMTWKVHQLFLYCCLGILAGIVGGLLGLGGGFILGPLFLELGVPPQVASATSTFAMTFSASMSVVQNYLLNRFPIPYAFYFMMIATIAALVGQHIVRKLVVLLGRASLIIFILALTIFVSAISLGGVGIANIVEKVEHREHMGFESLCSKT